MGDEAMVMYEAEALTMQLIQALACEPKPDQFLREDGSTDWEDYDYFHGQWQSFVDDIK